MSHPQTGLRNRIKRGHSASQSRPSSRGQSAADAFLAHQMRHQPPKRRYLGNRIRLKNKSFKTACLQILFSFGIVAIYFYISNKPSIECSDRDPMCPNKYFSNSYNESRSKFLNFSSQIDEAKTYNIPIIDIKSENDDECGIKQTLFTDITLINSHSKISDHLIIHISGLDGVAGYVGSGIQCAILNKMGEMGNKNKNINKNGKYIRNLMDGRSLDDHLNKKTDEEYPTVMFVHALNPYGMHYAVASNENNVELNRNLKTQKEWQQFNKYQHKNADIDTFLNPEYGVIDMVINTDKYIIGSQFFKMNWIIQYIWSYIIDWYLKTVFYGYYMLEYNGEFDYNQLFERFVVGQNYDSNGLRYVGDNNNLEKSHLVFMDFLKRKFKENEWEKQFKKITIIDVHSGFGKYGSDTYSLLVNNDNYLEQIQNIGRKYRIGAMVESRNYKKNEFANGIYKNVTGMAYQYIMDFIVNDAMKMNDNSAINVDTLGLLQGFSTDSMEYMLNAMRFHHSYHREYKEYVNNMDDNDPEQKRILTLIEFVKEYSGNTLKDAVYAKDLKWRRKVIDAGYDLFVALYRR